MRPAPFFLAFSCVSLTAQQSLPVGVFHGNLLALNDRPAAARGARSSGDFTMQAADGSTYGCEYDAHTLIQRDQTVVRADTLRPGDPVEVVSDRRAGACYARMLTVNETHAARMSPLRRAAGHLTDIEARGYITLSGLVVSDTGDTMVVRTRSGDKTLRRRSDTRYSGDGVRLDSPESVLNKHVFVRAGRDLRGVLEAYQVMWGETLLRP